MDNIFLPNMTRTDSLCNLRFTIFDLRLDQWILQMYFQVEMSDY